MKYRAEIDGLRAIAVIPVVLFHAGFEPFNGGFIGVDIFFVISGYLITTILIGEIESDSFSIANFYERRARRILPALFLVMALCLPFAWIWMLPNQMLDFSKSLIAVSLFSSNILFWRESGYFQAEAEEKPLLHTWSLSVEEQFYLLFPVFLLFAWRLGKSKLLFLISTMAFASLLLSEWGWRNSSSANFYLSPTRAWELFVGSLTAFFIQKHGVIKNSAMALVGFSLILTSIFLFNENTPMPSVYGLTPIAGVTLIIIYASKDTIVAKILSSKWLVFCGLLSYSAYLWHQPLFAFTKLRLLTPPSELTMALLCILSFVLAFFSWKYMEAPFRNRDFISRRQIFLSSALIIAAFISFGVFGYWTDGFAKRSTFMEVQKYQNIQNQSASGFRFCAARIEEGLNLPGNVCKIGDQSKEPSGLLWGDSYAGSALYGINSVLSEANQSFIAILGDGCPPIPGLSRVNNQFGCTHERNYKVLDWFMTREDLEQLILIGRFRPVLDKREDEVFSLDKEKISKSSLIKKMQSLAEDLATNKKKTILVVDGPKFKTNIPNYFSKAALFRLDVDQGIVSVTKESQDEKQWLHKGLFRGIESIDVIRSTDVFCGEFKCNALMADGELLVVDDGHISHPASLLLAKKIFTALDD